jgi:uncharacterized protein (TIGR03790 family)
MKKASAVFSTIIASWLGCAVWLPCPAHAQKPKAAATTDAAPKAVSEAAQTVVVFNANDPDSGDLARYYATRRGIPKEQIVSVKCPKTEEITRLEYDRDIAEPLRATFEKQGWWKLRAQDSPAGRVEATKIRFVALMRGMPLKIKAHFEPYEGDKPAGPPQIATHNNAAVDSELAVLGVFSRQISGAMNNPYFKATVRIGETPLAPLLLVTRLDAPTPELVRRMIDDALAAEQRGLRGMTYVDARGTKVAGLDEGDKWLYGAAEAARRQGVPVVLDKGEGLFPSVYPMTHAAGYLGWYADHVTGPFLEPGFRFARGAVAVHIHSFSGSSLRNPQQFWCAPLIAAGAAATIGNVYEPYLGLTPSLDVFYDRLLRGFTFAESCYLAQRFLSWQTTFVGDPLYRPYRAFTEGGEPRDEWEAYRAGARAYFAKDAATGTALLKANAQKFSSGMIWEGLGLLQLATNEADEAVKSFAQAAATYRNADDALRAAIHQVFQLKAMGRNPDALAAASKYVDKYRKEAAVSIIRVVEAELVVQQKAGTK